MKPIIKNRSLSYIRHKKQIKKAKRLHILKSKGYSNESIEYLKNKGALNKNPLFCSCVLCKPHKHFKEEKAKYKFSYNIIQLGLEDYTLEKEDSLLENNVV